MEAEGERLGRIQAVGPVGDNLSGKDQEGGTKRSRREVSGGNEMWKKERGGKSRENKR